MSEATQFYILTLLIFFAVDLLACWALNLQFGVTGVLNFAFVVFQGVGAYTVALLTLGPASNNGGFQKYIFGMQLPFPLPLIAAGIAGALASFLVGVVVLRRLRRDYQAIVMLVVSLIATNIAENQVSLVNGSSGLVLIPKPLESTLDLPTIQYQWLYALFALSLCAVVYFIIHRLTSSPLGRSLRAVRDNEKVLASTGRNPMKLQMMVMMVGGAIAAVSGGLLAAFLGAWGPTSWLFPTTFLYLTAVLIGGPGNNTGVILGALLIPTVLHEATRFLPEFGFPGMSEALQWVLIGVLMLVFIWYRPQGLLPEKPGRVAEVAGG
ncbi:MAG: branched-chain amino acid ABC transporter permease [Actinomycetota bacterium]